MTFDNVFEWHLVYNLGHSEDLMAVASAKLEPSDFTSAAAALTYVALKRHVERFGKLPDQGPVISVIREAMAQGVEGLNLDDRDRAEAENFAQALSGPKIPSYIDPLYYMGKLHEFALDRRYNKLQRESLDGPKTPDQLVATARRFGELAETGVAANKFVFESGLGDALFTEMHSVERISTGIAQLDQALHGGMAPELGQPGLFFAGQGVGKTVTLTNVANAGTAQNEGVLFITLEQPATAIRQINAAIEAHLRGSVFLKGGKGFTKDEEDRLAIVTSPQYSRRNLLTIVDWSNSDDTTVADVAEAVKLWRRAGDGGRRRLVVIDWLNYMEQRARARSRKRTDEELTELAVRLTKLARKERFALWTASQGTRETVGKAYLSRKDLAGAYHIFDPFEIAIGISDNQEDPEKRDIANSMKVDEDEPKDMRHTIVKNRYGPKDFTYNVHRGKTLKLWQDAAQARQYDDIAARADYRTLFNM